MTANAPQTLPLDAALQQAIAHHQAGRWQDAERLYRAILQTWPDHPDAHHNLGILAVQVKQPAAGLPHFKAALEANPKQGQYWLSYIDALMRAGQTATARQVLEQGRRYGLQGEAVEVLAGRLEDSARVAARPDAEDAASEPLPVPPTVKKSKPANTHEFARKKSVAHKGKAPSPQEIEALMVRFGERRYAEAASLARAMTVRFPRHWAGWKALGAAFKQMGRNTEALEPMQKAAALLPDDAEAHSNLGSTLSELGRLTEAEACCRRALQLKPDYAEAHYNLGNTLKDMGRLSEAEACYRLALALKPEIVEAHYNLGNILKDLGRLNEAEASCRRALALNPDYAEAYNNLGIILQDLGHLQEAETNCRRALALKPELVEAHYNLGNILKDLGRLNEAEACCRQALALKPDYAKAHNNLGNILQATGRLEEAEASYRSALQIKPDYEDAFGNLLFTLNYHPDKSAEQIYEVYREYDARFGLPHRSEWRPHPNSRKTQRRLKVGYVSPDFRKHSARHFLEPLLAHHDRQAVEVYAYAELTREDAVTARYKSYAGHWVPTVGLSDQELTERIRADGIDILVDLAGHTDKNRLGVFARKPAPVSLSWLGYGCTTGLSAIDYFLTDEVIAPAGSEGLFSEKPWRLAAPGYVYRPAEGMGEVNPLPAMSAGHVTFGTLSRGVRINHRTIRVWSEILKRVEGARLMIDSGTFREIFTQDMLAEKFIAHGISRDRLQIGCHSPAWDVLRKLDIGLDCFPHNSGTTLFETLYMGVPFVTLAGRPSVGRIGSSILEGAAHPEWIAGTEDEYVEKAVALALDLVELAALRSRLRRAMETGPLMDEAGFARKVEAAYREMFEKWAKG